MRDDAVAPVIAVMLILAALVTFLAVFNGIYIPSLKQSAEIDHIGHVEEAFYRFSSDLSFAVSSRSDRLALTEPVQMGGGDVVFNPLKSGGSLSVHTEEMPVYTLNLTTTDGMITTVNGTLVSVEYEPQGNFWQDQGYLWQFGYINVTKYGGRRSSPLSYDTVGNISGALGNQTTPVASFARAFAGTGYERNQTLVPSYDITNTSEITAYVPLNGTCSGIEIRAVSLRTDPDHTFASSNGYGAITLTTSVHRVSYGNVTGISVAADTSGSGPDAAFRNATLQGWGAAFSTLDTTATCGNNFVVNETREGSISYTLNRTCPVDVTVELMEIRVGVS
ncbi:MAG: hypothetical protein PHD55_06500 [Methanoregula sp.]|nr:hypothetical protein [Methanoregula sp.]